MASNTAYDSTARPLWELVVEIGAQVPDEEWAKVPTDLSKNVDHYLYGALKDDEWELSSADTGYWIALLNPRSDTPHQSYKQALGRC